MFYPDSVSLHLSSSSAVGFMGRCCLFPVSAVGHPSISVRPPVSFSCFTHAARQTRLYPRCQLLHSSVLCTLSGRPGHFYAPDGVKETAQVFVNVDNTCSLEWRIPWAKRFIIFFFIFVVLFPRVFSMSFRSNIHKSCIRLFLPFFQEDRESKEQSAMQSWLNSVVVRTPGRQ